MKVMLLTSSTGGGHDMRASSFEAWSKESATQSLNVQTARMQVLEQTHRLYQFGVELYNVIQKKAPRLHHLYFSYLENAAMHVHADGLLGCDRFVQTLERERPDVLLSTHAHLNHGFFDLARQVLGRNQVRCATYCGELFGGYGFSRFWVNPQADAFIGAVKETCQEAAHLDMPTARNWLGGFLLKPHFYEKPQSESERAEYIAKTLELAPDRFILVLATGANGANNHVACLRAIYASGLRPQVVALCGRNAAALESVQAWAGRHREMPVRALPYVEQMHHLMDAASCLFARAGTGTTSEAILRGCPIIFNGMGGVMPQEYITLKYARKHGFCHLAKRTGHLIRALEYMQEEAQMQTRQRMLALRPQQEPVDIFKHLQRLF